jgi:hypothetical protein
MLVPLTQQEPAVSALVALVALVAEYAQSLGECLRELRAIALLDSQCLCALCRICFPFVDLSRNLDARAAFEGGGRSVRQHGFYTF